jgi:hypothetical protein
MKVSHSDRRHRTCQCAVSCDNPQRIDVSIYLYVVEQVSHLTVAIKERQKETLDALKMAGDLEGKLDGANKRFVSILNRSLILSKHFRIYELTVQLSDRENQLKATRIFHQKYAFLFLKPFRD